MRVLRFAPLVDLSPTPNCSGAEYARGHETEGGAMRPTLARLCLRTVGGRWVAYIATGTTMDDAVEIGSIPLHTARTSGNARHSFVQLMRLKARHAVESSLGERIEFREGRQT